MSPHKRTSTLPESQDPDADHDQIIVERIPFSRCSECGAALVLRVWGEGIDSEVWCEADDCDEKVSYR